MAGLYRNQGPKANPSTRETRIGPRRASRREGSLAVLQDQALSGPRGRRRPVSFEVRTSRDVVGDWGAEFPRSLVLTDPGVRNWDISGLHNLERQNQLLRDQGWQDRALDDPALAPLLPCAAPLPGLAGLPIRMLRTLRKVRLQNAQVQGAGDQGPGQPRGARPRPG